jgi:hypothetical protein
MKKMAAMFLIVSIFILVAASARADEAREGASESPKITGFIRVGYYSQYVGNKSGATYHDKPVFQQTTIIRVEPWGVYAGAESTYSPKGGFNSDYGDEMDYYVGVKRKLGKLEFDLGYGYYDVIKFFRAKDDFHGPYIIVTFPEIYKLTPYVYLEWDIPIDRRVYEDAVLYRAGLFHTAIIWKQPVIAEISIAGHDEAYGWYRSEPVSSTKLSLSIPFKIWELKVTPKINFQKRLGYSVSDGGMTEDKIWGGLILSYSF